jgi:uncharacterized protein with FMN-binding domain
MRRILLWLMATITVVVLLFGYHTSREGATTTASPPAVVSGQSSSQSSSQSSTSGSGSTSGSTTVTGDTAQTRWGPVQVEITVADGKITDVSVPQYPSGNPRDQEINDYALPQLVDETIAAQSADIDMVSGATVTSEGYLTSLQSALDQAGL